MSKQVEVTFVDSKNHTVATYKVANEVNLMIEAAAVSLNALANFEALAIAGIGTLFSHVTFAKGKKWTVRSAVEKLMSDSAYDTLLGLLFPTHPEYDRVREDGTKCPYSYLSTLAKRDALPKDKRKDIQADLTKLSQRMRQATYRLAQTALAAYAADTLGFSHGDKKKVTLADRLANIIKLLSSLKKDADKSNNDIIAMQCAAALATIGDHSKRLKAPKLEDVWAQRKRNGTIKRTGKRTTTQAKVSAARKPKIVAPVSAETATA